MAKLIWDQSWKIIDTLRPFCLTAEDSIDNLDRPDCEITVANLPSTWHEHVRTIFVIESMKDELQLFVTTIHNRVIRWLYYYISCKSFVINRGCAHVRDLYLAHWLLISDQETGDCSSSVNTIFESILLDTLCFTQNNFTGKMKQHLLSGNVVYILCYRSVHCVGMTACYWSEQTYTIVNSRYQMSIQKHL